MFWGLGPQVQVLKVEVLDVGSKPFTCLVSVGCCALDGVYGKFVVLPASMWALSPLLGVWELLCF